MRILFLLSLLFINMIDERVMRRQSDMRIEILSRFIGAYDIR